ncbi:MAG: hypothetical protein IJ491_03295 [Clostridia bacterium]|nr:hypothetical protein [Clostridia bacterium]
MKKLSVLILCLSLVTGVITGCSRDEFVSVLRFTDNLNSQKNSEKISLDSYFVQNEIYSAVFADGEEKILLRLITDEKGYIEEIRLTAQKVDENGQNDPVTEKRKNLFTSSIARTVSAYTYLSQEEAEEIIGNMRLNDLSSYKAAGELTLTKGNFCFVYYSTDLVSMFMIYNIHLHPIEKTEKPESKPAYGNTTNIRTETVPLK